MADKLSITIALQGGEEIKRQLKDIGSAGQQAFDDIVNAAAKAGNLKQLKPEEVTAKLKEMGVTGEDAINKIIDAVKSAQRLESIVGIVQKVEGAFGTLSEAIGFAAKALGPFGAAAVLVMQKAAAAGAEAAANINKIDEAAIKAGMSIETFDKLSQTLRQAGVSAGAVADGIQKFASVMDEIKLEKLKEAGKILEEGQTRGFGGQGTAQWQLLSDAAQGVGKNAEYAQQELIKLGAVNLPESPVQRIKDLVAGTNDATAAARGLIAELQKMPDGLNRNAAAANFLGQKLGTEVVQGLRTGNLSAESFDKVVQTLSQETANASNSVVQSTNKISNAWERFKTTGDISNLGTIWTEYSSSVSKAVDDSISRIDDLIKKIGELNATRIGTEGGAREQGVSSTGFAGGGLLGGSGSGTSDSNLAWVSRGEHIMPAAVVRQPGVLALLESLRMGGSFAMGGVMPRFAAGGLVGGMGHLGTVDLRTDHGSVTLMASGSAVDQLSRLAVQKRMTSTGRKPGFIG